MYSSSQNNVNVVYCNYKEITSSYSVNTKRNLPHSLLNLGNILSKCLFETLKKHVICKIVTVIRSTNTSKILNNATAVKLHCIYTVITQQLRTITMY